ncbi:MAG: fibronectin type III domain-containing protein [bacterium]
MQHLTPGRIEEHKPVVPAGRARSRLLMRGAVITLGLAVVILGGCQALGIGPNDGGAVSAPAAPTGLSATAASDSEIELTWSDESGNETGFEIERREGTRGDYSGLTTTSADVESYTDSDVSANTTYSYRIRAVNDADTSDWIDGASASTDGASYSVTVTDPETGSAISDVHVFINDPADGSLIDSTQTGSSGEATLTDVSPTPVTLSLAREYESGDGLVQSIVNVDPGSYSIHLGAGGESGSSTSVTLELTDRPQDYEHGSLLPLEPSFESDFDGEGSGEITVLDSELDNQGEFNAVVVALNSDYVPISYGVLSDQELSDDETYQVSVDDYTSIPEYSFSIDRSVQMLSAHAVHDGAVYPISNEEYFSESPQTTGDLQVYDQFPVDPGEGDEYLLTAVGGDEGTSFLYQPTRDTLPNPSDGFDMTVPDYTMSSFSYDATERHLSWDTSGSASVSVVVTGIDQTDSNGQKTWTHVGPGDSTDARLPELPSAIDNWLDDPDNAYAVALDARGIDNLDEFRAAYLDGSDEPISFDIGSYDLRFGVSIGESMQPH